MNSLIETLRLAISTNMLGESVSWLAVNLHYKGRTSLYRINNGTATITTVREMCKRLQEYQHLTEDDLFVIGTTIKNVEYFSKHVRKEMNQKHSDWVFQSMLPFILDCYDYFSPTFQKEVLPNILHLKKEDPTAFFNMLAYYYIKYTYSNFYSIAGTHQERCHKVAERLGQRLAEVDSGNVRGLEMASRCGRGFVFDIEPPTMWTVVGHVASIIQTFTDPATMSIDVLETILIPEMYERTFWQGDSSDRIIVLQPVQTTPGRGVYVLLSLDCQTMELTPLLRIYFYDASSLSIENLEDSTTLLGFYTLSDTTFSINWEHPEDDPTEFGNLWRKIDPYQHPFLSKFNKSLSVSYICELALRKEGWEPVEGLEVKDVVISREVIKIIFDSGLSKTIPRDKFPKLSQVTADTFILVLRNIVTGIIYISWPTIGLAIPCDTTEPAVTT